MFISGDRNHTLMALLLLTALIILKSAEGHPAGGTGDSAGDAWVEDDVIPKGCWCHGDEQLNKGMYNLEGIPNEYIPKKTYNITLTVNDTSVERADSDNGKYGGFVAVVTEGEFVQNGSDYWIGGDGAYLSHNENSNDFRTWVFQWTAPDEGTGDATFTIYFNVVNGGEATSGDQWSSLTVVSLGTPQKVSGEVSIHELGVTLMQYWIGLLGIAVVLLSVLISYIVMRGGSSHYRG